VRFQWCWLIWLVLACYIAFPRIFWSIACSSATIHLRSFAADSYFVGQHALLASQIADVMIMCGRYAVPLSICFGWARRERWRHSWLHTVANFCICIYLIIYLIKFGPVHLNSFQQSTVVCDCRTWIFRLPMITTAFFSDVFRPRPSCCYSDCGRMSHLLDWWATPDNRFHFLMLITTAPQRDLGGDPFDYRREYCTIQYISSIAHYI